MAAPHGRMFIALLSALLTVACGESGPTSASSGPATPDTGAPTGPAGPSTQTPSYQFGAKFEPPEGRVVHGLGQWESYNVTYSAQLSAALQPASELLFTVIGDTPRGWEPEKFAASLAAIDARGRIPLIDIALRGLKPTDAQIAALPDPLYGIDHEIANGTKYDGRLQDVANALKAFKKPVMMRIGGEFSGWWNGYHPYEYPKAFRKIVAMVRAAGASNVAFVWCYEPAASDDFDAKNAAGANKWYPGADVVDWFSIDLFATADVGGPATGHGGLTPYGRTLKFLNMAVAESKPVVIAESAPMQFDITKSTDATAAWDNWFTPYFGLISARPEIKWFVYISYDWTKAGDYNAQGWKNNDLASSSLLGAYKTELGKAKYLHAAERALLKDYSSYK